MLIQINTDNHVKANPDAAATMQAELESALSRFESDLTRVEVFLQDGNGDKSGAGDKRCTLEARIIGQDPVAVSNDASTIPAAFHGARDKLVRMLDSHFGKLRHPKAHDRTQPDMRGASDEG